MPHPNPLPSIGIVTGSMSRNAGGLFNSVRKSALHLQAAGCDIGIYALQDEFSEPDRAEWEPLKPKVFPPAVKRPLAFAPKLHAKLTEVEHDVLHLHGIWGLQSLAVSRWKRKSGRPVMISPRGMLDPWALRNSAWKKRIVGALFENANLHGADCLHALNDSEAESMRSYGLTNPIAIIPNGADLPELGQTARAGERKRLLFLGRIHPKKGLTELIDAWKIACEKRPEIASEWVLSIAGWDDGGHEAGLRKQIDEHGLSSSIELLGPAFGEEKERLLRNASAFVLPSFSEGLPMSVLEAWSYGLPVLMTDECNLPVGFEKGAAVRIETGPPELATQLLATLSRDDLEQIGLAGRALVEERFTWSQIAAQHIAVYQWMCGQGARPLSVRLD